MITTVAAVLGTWTAASIPAGCLIGRRLRHLEDQTMPDTDLPALAVACPDCGSAPGALCTSHGGTRVRRHNVHQARTRAHASAGRPAPANTTED